MSTPDVSEEELERYRATRRRRDEKARRDQKRAVREARVAAHQAAVILREHFAVERVVLFGSIARDEYLGPRSDVDLAVEGLPARDYAWAVDHVQEASPRRRIDLVRIEQCSSSMTKEILNDGVEL